MKNDASEDESDEENEEGDYTVYECPGLAPVSKYMTSFCSSYKIKDNTNNNRNTNCKMFQVRQKSLQVHYLRYRT